MARAILGLRGLINLTSGTLRRLSCSSSTPGPTVTDDLEGIVNLASYPVTSNTSQGFRELVESSRRTFLREEYLEDD